jgi:4-hydroxybenzoate polyprenyltransferase
MKLNDLLDLLRIPNVFTAVSDIVAATAVAWAVRPENVAWSSALAALGASACLYLAGMALNDVADAERDARERPERPIPSGRVSRGQAMLITSVLVLAGLALAWIAGGATLLVAALLLAAIVAYDLALAGRPGVGPLGMAACRALNLLMGLVAANGLGVYGLAAVGLWAIYVLGLTHLSLSEVEGPGRPAVVVAALVTLLTSLGVVFLGGLMQPSRTTLSWVALGFAVLVFAGRGGWMLAQAWIQPDPARMGRAVGALVSGILWLGAALAVAAAGPLWLVPFLILAAGQESLRRHFRVT